MKLIILLLVTFNAHAQWKVEWNEYHKVKPTKQEAKDYLESVILKSKWIKCNWKLSRSSNTYAEKMFLTYDENNAPIYTMKYCKPKNISVVVSNISSEIAAQEAKNQAKKDKKNKAKAIKATNKKWKNMSAKQKDDLIDYILDNIE